MPNMHPGRCSAPAAIRHVRVPHVRLACLALKSLPAEDKDLVPGLWQQHQKLLVALHVLLHPYLFQERLKQLALSSSDPLWVEEAHVPEQGQWAVPYLPSAHPSVDRP